MFSDNAEPIDYELLHISQLKLLNYYFGIDYIPCLVCSPLREDKHPSFRWYMTSGGYIRYKDFSTGENGRLSDAVETIYGHTLCDMCRVAHKLKNESSPIVSLVTHDTVRTVRKRSKCRIDVVLRPWENYDLEYWGKYGITLNWLRFADVYPVKRIIRDWGEFMKYYSVDKYAYCYVERKDGIISKKIYQPFSKEHKWTSTMDRSTISLWTKVPMTAERIVICSSLKDALCLSVNTHIPAIALQGEAYPLSESAQRSLRERYDKIYIFFDNDGPGLADSLSLAQKTGFKRVLLPEWNNCKDVSDYYVSEPDKGLFKERMFSLFD